MAHGANPSSAEKTVPMQEPPPVETVINALQQFAVEIARLLSGRDTEWRRSREAREWSLTEVVCHLRDVEREVHQPRIRALLREEGAFLPGAVADEWVDERQYWRQDGAIALEDFIAAREDTVALIKALDEPLLQRQGQHAFFGPTTMHELLYLMMQHDEAHREQIAKLLEG